MLTYDLLSDGDGHGSMRSERLAPVTPATLEGPIPVTSSSHPFNGARWSKRPLDVAAFGAVQEEYYARGEAGVYEWVPYSDYEVTQLRSAEYTTRLLVTRPADPARFSGRVVVDIINMSAGYDWQAIWSALWERVLANGDAFVGVTSKPNVFAPMARFDPGRYSRLSMPNPLPPSEQCCGLLPGEEGYDPNLSRSSENGLIWDILSQVAAVLKSDGADNPIGRPAQRLYLAGESQSGDYLLRYFRWFHRRSLDAGGAPLFDGYLCEDGVADIYAIPPLHQCGHVTVPLPVDDPQRLIPGRGAPLVLLHSEWLMAARLRRHSSALYPPVLQAPSPRKPDSDTPADRFVMWELAGACHGWRWQYEYGDADPADLERAGIAVEGGFSLTPLQPEVNLYMAEKAAYEWLDAWVTEGRRPPSAPYVEVRDGDPVRDEHGNAVGGLRMPEIAVPIATYTGLYAPGPDGTDAIRPFDLSLLGRLYSSHEEYVSRFAEAAYGLEADGFLLPEDARTLVERAQERDVP